MAVGFGPLGFRGSQGESQAPAGECILPTDVCKPPVAKILSFCSQFVYVGDSCWCFKHTDHLFEILFGDTLGASQQVPHWKLLSEAFSPLLHSWGASRSGAKPPVLLHCWESMPSHGDRSWRLLYYLLVLFQYHLPGAVADEGLATPAAVQAQNSYRKLHLWPQKLISSRKHPRQ